MVKPKWFAFECPECEHEEVYFQQQVTPEGTARCQLCRAEVKAETIIEIRERRERQYREKMKNPMMRTLDLAPGTHGKCRNKDEE
jgi:ribosomal protein S27E